MQNSKRTPVILSGLVTSVLAACSSASSSFGDGGTQNDAGHADARADVGSLRHDGAVADVTSEAAPGKDAGPDAHPAPPADAKADTSTCDPMDAPKAAPCSITDAIGVFVAPTANGGSDTTGAGTMSAPFATVGHAIMSAGTKRVYVCGATYPEQVTVTTNVSVYGGLACPLSAGSTAGTGGVPAWSYTGTLASIVPTAPGYALDVEVVTSATFEDMGFIAQAADPTTPGASSIAVMLNQSTGVQLVRVKASAGAGAAGAAAGAASSNWCAATGQGGTVGTGTAGGSGGGHVARRGRRSGRPVDTREREDRHLDPRDDGHGHGRRKRRVARRGLRGHHDDTVPTGRSGCKRCGSGSHHRSDTRSLERRRLDAGRGRRRPRG